VSQKRAECAPTGSASEAVARVIDEQRDSLGHLARPTAHAAGRFRSRQSHIRLGAAKTALGVSEHLNALRTRSARHSTCRTYLSARPSDSLRSPLDMPNLLVGPPFGLAPLATRHAEPTCRPALRTRSARHSTCRTYLSARPSDSLRSPLDMPRCSCNDFTLKAL
jgi:hypothetical protein